MILLSSDLLKQFIHHRSLTNGNIFIGSFALNELYCYFHFKKVNKVSCNLRKITKWVLIVRVLVDDDAKYPFPTTSFRPTNSLTTPLVGKGHKSSLVAGPSSSLHNESLFDLEENVRNMNLFDELAMKQAFGPKYEVAQAIRAAVMWSYIYNPIEEGPLLTVSRSPSWADTFANKAGAANPDWTYVIFAEFHCSAVELILFFRLPRFDSNDIIWVLYLRLTSFHLFV